MAEPLEEGGDRRDLQHEDGDQQLQQDAADHKPLVDGLAVVAGQEGDAQDHDDADQADETLHVVGVRWWR